jgi:hypothetical protein
VPNNADLTKYQIHISIWNEIGAEPFLGHCYIPILTAIQEATSKCYPLVALRDDSLIAKVKSRSKEKYFGKDLAALLQLPIASTKYNEKTHIFSLSPSVLAQAAKGMFYY